MRKPNSSCIRCAAWKLAREIGLTYEALNGIIHHHERYYGLGYPMGLDD